MRWPGPSVHREALAACPSCRIVRLAMPEIAIPERGFVPAAGKQLIGAVDQALFSARRVGIACFCEAERQRRGGEGAAAAEKSAGSVGRDAASKRIGRLLSQIIQKSSESLLTLWTAPDYIRLNNEGGAPLAQTSSPLCYEIKRAA